MRILIISHAYVSKYHQEKIEALAKNTDLEIFLMVPEFGIEGGGRKIYLEKKYDPSYKIIPIKMYFSGKWNTYLIKGFRDYIRKIKPDIIHLEEEYWTNVAWQVARVKEGSPKIKFVLFTWENIYHDWPGEGRNFYQKLRFSIFNRIEKKVLRSVDAVIAGNREAVEVLRKKGFGGQVEVLPQFGLNERYFTKKDVEGLKMELKLEDEFIIGFIGRVNKEKGLEDLIRVGTKPYFTGGAKMDIKFLIIGDGGYKTEAQRLVRELELEQSVIFLPAVDFNRIVEYYNLMDIMVIPSRTTPQWKEQFGRTIIEAMSCGVPVIGSDSGAIPEVIGEGGLIFKEGNVDDLADKISNTINDGKFRSDLIQKGLRRVQENFTTTIIARRTYEIYNTLK